MNHCKTEIATLGIFAIFLVRIFDFLLRYLQFDNKIKNKVKYL